MGSTFYTPQHGFTTVYLVPLLAAAITSFSPALAGPDTLFQNIIEFREDTPAPSIHLASAFRQRDTGGDHIISGLRKNPTALLQCCS